MPYKSAALIFEKLEALFQEKDQLMVTRTVNNSQALLNPKFQRPLAQLLQYLLRAEKAGLTKTHFELYEGYRSPERQQYLLAETKSTKAGPWQSAHNYGLAADIVPRINGRWTWAEHHDWAFLKRAAEQHGLSVPISWDRAHVQSPLFAMIVKILT